MAVIIIIIIISSSSVLMVVVMVVVIEMFIIPLVNKLLLLMVMLQLLVFDPNYLPIVMFLSLPCITKSWPINILLITYILDINECDTDVCDPVKEVCTNMIGSYFCACADGFESVTHGNVTQCEGLL